MAWRRQSPRSLEAAMMLRSQWPAVLCKIPSRRLRAPQPLARDRGAFAERLELGPDDAVGDDRIGPHRGAEAAIDAGNDALPADDVGVAADALRDKLRVLDEVRR